ncbi:Peroxiredoxin [Candidatus Nitrotoga sp. BS]|uniref:peroxiredoxin n=1 Tax=Candidatus Nitrotoga sp. BS TaxID=2890408 RepID=UPI001EF246A5|nr:peroxiredoxin [Candidatus Nitrotoga sp. BS]CAH1206511.1 Peroxiredoxin [Candidatus Nitrotoga sp. BS]
MQNSNKLPTDVLLAIPPDLPVPIDDGACAHIEGLPLPSVALPSTDGNSINLSQVGGWLVIFCYPMTGRPGRSVPDGWAQIPGAAGCTPQACSFRDHFAILQKLNVKTFGLSAQTTDDQLEAAARLHLPFALLSDADLQFSQSLCLPMLHVKDLHLTKRVTLITKDGIIKKCIYPVFPSDKNVEVVIGWLSAHDT